MPACTPAPHCTLYALNPLCVYIKRIAFFLYPRPSGWDPNKWEI